MSKFLYLIFLFLTPAVLLSQIPGNIVVYPDSEKIPISPYLFGSGDEMTACFSPLADIQPLITATRPSLLRFGGIGAEYFDWQGDSLGGLFYLDFFDTLIIPSPVYFGIDSFLRICEAIGAEPILTVNMQIGDTALARNMVEYVNGDTTTPLGNLRAHRGHPAPYNVSIWSLGNEPDIAGGQWPVPPWGYWTFYRHYNIPFSNWSWQDSAFWTPQDFASLIPLYVNSMENASPIPLEFIYSIAGNPAWVRPVIEPNINLIDYLDVHYYPSSASDTIADTTDYIEWLRKSDTIFAAEPYIQSFRDSLNAIGASNIEPIVLEYNAGMIMIPDHLWWNYLTGLFIADCIGHWMHAGLKMAAVYSIHEGDSSNPGDFPYFGVIRGDTASRRMPSYVLELYNTYFGDTLICAFSDHKNTGYGIECWASKRSSDNRYALVVVNKTLDTTYAMTIQIHDSIQLYRLRNITNNAPIGAPYNGTTGIEDQGLFVPDSIHSGVSYLNQVFVPASVSLLEVLPYTGIAEESKTTIPDFRIPMIVRKGVVLEVPRGTYTLYSVTGRKVEYWRDTEKLSIPYLPQGIYFLRTEPAVYRKIIIF
ncbi:MAG TPA: hypothetical protein ENI34_02465 [candidate division WOR-3 bacterium]|uniref:Alpha-L-arabinofuranosidase 1 catalytic domain-containing protein n=1 Tax=candidate division WOR-3 bacterium TaxID=2052148 RepID=A0A9C9ELA9_UNCW3|nr:hypothetical protein [candidate division WOR-3 bacterium]